MAVQPDMNTKLTASEKGLYQILVADDDPAMVRLLQENLAEFGYTVRTAYDGQAVIRSALQYRPDLIIMDVNMPMTSGLKALEYLRARPDTSRIPVIFITGELSKDIYPVIAATSRVAHMKKPLDLENLNSLIHLFLERYTTA
jgi:CheY-like chemotaxis protein